MPGNDNNNEREINQQPAVNFESMKYCSVSRVDFWEKTGPNVTDYAEMPIDFFYELFPETLIQDFVYQTNLYVTQKSGGNNPYPTTIDEVKNFLAINILMGIKKLPSYRDYWCSD